MVNKKEVLIYMAKKKLLEVFLNDKYFSYACTLIVICFLITHFYGRIKIIGILSFLSIVLLAIDFYKSKLYKNIFIFVMFSLIFLAGIAFFLYAFNIKI